MASFAMGEFIGDSEPGLHTSALLAALTTGLSLLHGECARAVRTECYSRIAFVRVLVRVFNPLRGDEMSLLCDRVPALQ